MNTHDDLAAIARAAIDANRYLTLGTTEPDQRPRLSPVYFTHVSYRRFYWVSSPLAHHSRNVAGRPAVAIVIFDSTAEIGMGRAVYVDAIATEVSEDELEPACAEAFAAVDTGAHAFTPAELAGGAKLRLYRADATTHELHVPGRDPVHGTGIDRRVPVSP
jgi:hypothetical protein